MVLWLKRSLKELKIMSKEAKLAKRVAKEYIEKGKKPDFELPLFKRKAGVFITLKISEKLKGCIGTVSPTKDDLAEEILENTISACKDPRFSPIKKEELDYLKVEVSILKEPTLFLKSNEKDILEKIEKINPKEEGIIVKSERKTSLLLPGLEGIESPRAQFIAALEKGGIDIKEESFSLYKFKVEKHEG